MYNRKNNRENRTMKKCLRVVLFFSIIFVTNAHGSWYELSPGDKLIVEYEITSPPIPSQYFYAPQAEPDLLQFHFNAAWSHSGYEDFSYVESITYKLYEGRRLLGQNTEYSEPSLETSPFYPEPYLSYTPPGRTYFKSLENNYDSFQGQVAGDTINFDSIINGDFEGRLEVIPNIANPDLDGYFGYDLSFSPWILSQVGEDGGNIPFEAETRTSITSTRDSSATVLIQEEPENPVEIYGLFIGSNDDPNFDLNIDMDGQGDALAVRNAIAASTGTNLQNLQYIVADGSNTDYTIVRDIKDTIDSFFDGNGPGVDENDLFILYIASHGSTTDGNGGEVSSGLAAH